MSNAIDKSASKGQPGCIKKKGVSVLRDAQLTKVRMSCLPGVVPAAQIPAIALINVAVGN